MGLIASVRTVLHGVNSDPQLEKCDSEYEVEENDLTTATSPPGRAEFFFGVGRQDLLALLCTTWDHGMGFSSLSSRNWDESIRVCYSSQGLLLLEESTGSTLLLEESTSLGCHYLAVS